ncbi:AlbA family DNA-binding domain-containing protein [Streptomyces prasinus]|uniref:AlbA family DNA-binding domain-containing protein n=1 Tax=Streptomyces prasinus TaxID=67345 RepID=UPI0036A5B664
MVRRQTICRIKFPAGKIEFAKDVAQFANASGGILVVGATNKKKPGGVEVLDKLHALDKDPGITSLPAFMQSARDTIDAHTYPHIEGVEVSSSTTRKGEVMYVYVPSQLPKRKPFIVSGENVGGVYRNTFFSIPQRRRDGNLSTSPKEIHHLLAGKMRNLG